MESPPLILGWPGPSISLREVQEDECRASFLSLAQPQLLAKLWTTRDWSLGPGMGQSVAPVGQLRLQTAPQASAALKLYHLVPKPRKAVEGKLHVDNKEQGLRLSWAVRKRRFPLRRRERFPLRRQECLPTERASLFPNHPGGPSPISF